MLVEMITCRRCQRTAPAHNDDKHLCDDCAKAENSRVSHYRQLNYNWMEVAKEAELNVWERQPGETDHEFHVWLCYRDAYPSKRPTYRDVAEQLTTTINAVKKIGTRWSFPARLQAYAKMVDDLTMAQRKVEILDMNKKHVDMASTLADKLKKAIDMIDPYSLSPKEIQGLFKLSTEIERKARLDQVAAARTSTVDDANPEIKKELTDSGNMQEILQILGKAGALNNIGVRQTVTTEVVVKGDD